MGCSKHESYKLSFASSLYRKPVGIAFNLCFEIDMSEQTIFYLYLAISKFSIRLHHVLAGLERSCFAILSLVDHASVSVLRLNSFFPSSSNPETEKQITFWHFYVCFVCIFWRYSGLDQIYSNDNLIYSFSPGNTLSISADLNRNTTILDKMNLHCCFCSVASGYGSYC